MTRTKQTNAPAVVGAPEPARREPPVVQMIQPDFTPIDFNAAERAALASAYALLRRIAARHEQESEVVA